MRERKQERAQGRARARGRETDEIQSERGKPGQREKGEQGEIEREARKKRC
jgi:hypothetical protein